MLKANTPLEKVETISRNWLWFLLLGFVLILLGVAALGATWIVALASAIVFGWLLMFSGISEALAAIWAREWNGFFLHLLTSVLYVVVGVLIIANPVGAAAALTILLAVLFLTRGLFRLIAAATLRYPGWPWAVFDGVVTLVLGLLIWRHWPDSTLWVIGTFVGIDLLFRGWSWVMFALGMRKVRQVEDAFATTVVD